MTLHQLKRLNPAAHAEWVKGYGDRPLTPEQEYHTARAYKVNGMLFIVWNNGAFYESFKYLNGKWESQAVPGNRGYRAKYYVQACKTLARLDRPRIYG